MIGNHIHDLGEQQRFEHGIYCESARGTVIADNVIHDIASGYGIHLFGDCDGTRIVRNTIAHNGLSGIIIAGNDQRGTADGTLIARNVIAEHTVAAWSEYGFAVTEYQAGRAQRRPRQRLLPQRAPRRTSTATSASRAATSSATRTSSTRRTATSRLQGDSPVPGRISGARTRSSIRRRGGG